MSWHPDLAKDGTNRLLLELRLEQVNGTWEIIQGKRAEVRPTAFGHPEYNAATIPVADAD